MSQRPLLSCLVMSANSAHVASNVSDKNRASAWHLQPVAPCGQWFEALAKQLRNETHECFSMLVMLKVGRMLGIP